LSTKVEVKRKKKKERKMKVAATTENKKIKNKMRWVFYPYFLLPFSFIPPRQNESSSSLRI
jgi:hypothetical protein